MCAFAFCEIAGLRQDEAIVPMNSGRGLRVPSSISRPQHGKNSAISVLRYQLDPDSNNKKNPQGDEQLVQSCPRQSVRPTSEKEMPL